MVNLIPDVNPLKPFLRAIEDLGGYATSYRYPSSAGNLKATPDPSAFNAYAANVERALSAAMTAFQVDLAKQNAPAGRATPIR